MNAWKQALAKVEVQMKWAVLFALVLALLTAVRDVAAMDEHQALVIWIWNVAAQLTLFLYWALVAPLVLPLQLLPQHVEEHHARRPDQVQRVV